MSRMRKIIDIYEQYKIMPNLQLHQLRVAAVAKQICESFNIEINHVEVITSCLLHDMGNIIKAKLDNDLFPMTEAEKEYWIEEKTIFMEKYGNDESSATAKVVKEIGVSEAIQHLIEHNDFKYICDISESDSLQKKVIKYSDLRVGPHGIVSLDGRFEDIIKRYSKLLNGDRRDCAEDLEKQIFSHSSIKPEDINDESVKNIIEDLKNFEV